MTTYLTKITTPTNLTRDIHRTHQTLTTTACPPKITTPGRAATRLLHRVERDGHELLVQSAIQLDAARLNPACTIVGVKTLDSVLNHLTDNTTVRYKITANPTHAPNRNRKPITDPYRIHDWWHRVATRIGLRLEGAELVEAKKTVGRKRGARIVVHAATLEGFATISDAGLVRGAIESGVGHARAYGCGLLSVVPVG